MNAEKKYKFKAEIYKVGINWCVNVPTEITSQLIAEKGKVIYKNSFGLANETSKEKLNENSVFELASVKIVPAGKKLA